MKRALLLLALTAVALWSQLATTSLVGTVTDPSGLPMAGVSITAARTDTGRVRSTTSNERGDFVFNSLDPGSYVVTFVKAGFKTKEIQNVVLVIGETVPIGKLQLELGSVSDKVQVTAQAESVMTRSSERASEITSAEIEDLEVRGRNF